MFEFIKSKYIPNGLPSRPQRLNVFVTKVYVVENNHTIAFSTLDEIVQSGT